jgi:hypothetical protein
MHGLTIGTLEAIDAVAYTIRVANVTYHLETPGLLMGLEVGQFVSVAWDQTSNVRPTRIARIVVSATRLSRNLPARRSAPVIARGQDEHPAHSHSRNGVHSDPSQLTDVRAQTPGTASP